MLISENSSEKLASYVSDIQKKKESFVFAFILLHFVIDGGRWTKKAKTARNQT